MAYYRTYQDASGIEHESYEAACIYYGADTPAQIAEEERYYAELEAAEWLDHCAAHDLFVDWHMPAPAEVGGPF